MADVNGTNNSETINLLDGVTNGYDIIYGYGGDDSIWGLGGDDIINGGAGADATQRRTRLRYGELLELHRRHHCEPGGGRGGRRRRGRRHLLQHRESFRH